MALNEDIIDPPVEEVQTIERTPAAAGPKPRGGLMGQSQARAQSRVQSQEDNIAAEQRMLEERRPSPGTRVEGTVGFTNLPTIFSDEALGAGGAGAVRKEGSVKVTQTGVAPAEEQLRLLAARSNLVQHQAAQLDARAQGYGLQTDLFSQLAVDMEENAVNTIQEVNDIFDRADRQLQGIQELVDDARSNRINPGQFFANVGDAGNFAASMAVASGHLAAALGGGPNTALSVINGAIARNMRAQELNQAHDRAMINAELGVFDRMQRMGIDRMNAANVYQAMLNQTATAQLESIQAATASVETRTQIDQLKAQLLVQTQQSVVDSYAAVQAEVQYDISNRVQYNAAAQRARAAAAEAVRLAGAAGPGGEQIARAPSGAGVGAGRGTGRPGERADLQSVGQAIQADQRMQSGDPGLMTEAIQEHARSLGRRLSAQEIQAIQQQYPETQRMPEEAFQPVYRKQDIMEIDGEQFLKKQAYHDLPDTERVKVDNQMHAQKRITELFREADMLLKEVMPTTGVGEGSFADFLTVKNGSLVPTAKAPPEVIAKVNRLNTVMTNIINEKRTEKGSDAIKGPAEWAIFERMSGLPSSGQQFWNAILGGGNKHERARAAIEGGRLYADETYKRNIERFFHTPESLRRAR